jgi:TatD DNase family protein
MPVSTFENGQFLDFHTHAMRHDGDDRVIEIVSLHLGQYKKHHSYTIGLHPWWTDQAITPIQKQQFIELLSEPNCLAMGEMGLDNLKGPTLEIQMEILRSQLRIADELGKSVVIHCVRAFDQIIKIKKEFPKIEKWCIHGYGRHGILAKQLIYHGFYLSLMPGLPIEKYNDLLRAVPLNRLFLETDSMPDANIVEIYSKIAALLGIEINELCQQMNSNAKEFFKL